MAKHVGDVVVLLPGITGSVLRKDGKDVWAPSGGAVVNALLSLGHDIKDLKLGDDPPGEDEIDGVSAPRLMPDIHLIPGLWKIDGYGRIRKWVTRQLRRARRTSTTSSSRTTGGATTACTRTVSHG